MESYRENETKTEFVPACIGMITSIAAPDSLHGVAQRMLEILQASTVQQFLEHL